MDIVDAEPYRYDLFISYSTDPDAALARDVERFLESFHHLKTPKEMALRALNVCRDGSDFSLARLRERAASEQGAVTVLIEGYLKQSRQLLVICSDRARDSEWVNLEIRWFLEHRGAESIVLAVSEGVDPGVDAAVIFSPIVLAAALNGKPWYDFRAFRGRPSREWRKVKLFEDEKVRLAADLNGMSAGEVLPVWFREQQRSKRRQLWAAGVAVSLIAFAVAAALYQQTVARRELGLKQIARVYELLYRDPSAALLKAYRAIDLVPGVESQAALKAAYKVAVLQHYNRRETAQMTGRGPSYLAGRWKQGDVYATSSPDGRYRLVVTERGQDGPNPPGDVYLLDNESSRTVKLGSCSPNGGRVEDAGFDDASSRIFVSRHFEVNLYDTSGRCTGLIPMNCCTKSPVHLVRGLLADRFALVSETKGGLWLVDTHSPKSAPMTLQREFFGDAAVSTALSPDRSQAVVVFESGRAAWVAMPQGGKPALTEIAKTEVLFAAFDPGRKNQVLTSGVDGFVRRFDIAEAKPVEIGSYRIADTAIDFIGFSDDRREMLAVGENRAMYVVDSGTGRVLRAIREAEGIDWATTRVLSVEPESVLPEHVQPQPTLPPADSTSIERYGDLIWFKRAADVPSGFLGPVIRLEPDGAAYFPSKDVEVTAIASHEGQLYLATARGLYALSGTDFKRISRATMEIHGLYPISGKLWVATRRGGYLLDRGRLYRVTDSLAPIRVIKAVDGRIWMLTESSGGGFGRKYGPAYRVDGYLSQPLPNPKARIFDVVSVAGKTWMAGNPGLYVMGEERALPVGKLPEDVTAIEGDAGGVLVKTEIRNWPYVSDGPQYQVDPASLAVRKL